MERTCRCGKAGCPQCEAWWAARALNPPTIGRGPLRLVYDAPVVYRECQYCGYQIPDPYDEIGQRPVTCSTCYYQQTSGKKRLPGNDLPAVCDCAQFFLAHGGLGWPLSQCDVQKCMNWPAFVTITPILTTTRVPMKKLPPPPTRPKRTSARQGKLF